MRYEEIAGAVSWGQVVGAALEEYRRGHGTTGRATPMWAQEEGRDPRTSAVPSSRTVWTQVRKRGQDCKE